jgi:hypothetical protein
VSEVTGTYRDVQLKRRAEWATDERLHPAAIKLAGQYLNFDEQALRLISEYEKAADLPQTNEDNRVVRNKAMREAWLMVLRYIRVQIAIAG